MFTFTINNVYTSVLFSQGWEHNIILNALTFERPASTFGTRPGTWHGSHCFLKRNPKGRYFFPTGLLALVVEKLPTGLETKFTDNRKRPATVRKINPSKQPSTDPQKGRIEAAIARERGIIQVLPGKERLEVAAGIVKTLGIPKTLYIAKNVALLRQAATFFKDELDLCPGIIADGEQQPGRLTVASILALVKRRDEPGIKAFLDSVHVLFIDCQNRPETWYRVGLSCPAYYRFAFTGIESNPGTASDVRLTAITGKPIYPVQ
ncbi:MAG TPA: hypothetical protein ENN18_01650 [Proteobacteria bacterium]|nr:hypothetical protein [Pseudomonadota bacterium]